MRVYEKLNGCRGNSEIASGISAVDNHGTVALKNKNSRKEAAGSL